jgi:hypothetical protein
VAGIDIAEHAIRSVKFPVKQGDQAVGRDALTEIVIDLAISSPLRKPAVISVRRLPCRSAISSAAGIPFPATSPTTMATRFPPRSMMS